MGSSGQTCVKQKRKRAKMKVHPGLEDTRGLLWRVTVAGSSWHLCPLYVVYISWEPTRISTFGVLGIIWCCPGTSYLTGPVYLPSQFCHTLSPASFPPGRPKSHNSLRGAEGGWSLSFTASSKWKGCRPYLLAIKCCPTTLECCGLLAGLKAKTLLENNEKRVTDHPAVWMGERNFMIIQMWRAAQIWHFL